MEIYDVLHADHRQILETLEELEEATGEQRSKLLALVADELTLHTVAEDEVLYDRLATNPHMRALILEAKQEHHVVGVLLKELLALDADDERFFGKIKVLTEVLESHIEEEEEDLFDEARRLLGPAGEGLAAEFLSAKERYVDVTPLDRIAMSDKKNEQKQPTTSPEATV
ncbi:MAG: hemerythrin domain-containing protein [Deltaproteobacteria bacterium]|nr:hemerythrin domain-containing protein [Deltaproteobacteria bacterium]